MSGRKSKLDKAAKKTISGFLSGLQTKQLVDLLLEQCERDDALYRRLLAESSSLASTVSIEPFRQSLQRAFRTGKFIGSGQARAYAVGVLDALSGIEGLVDRVPEDELVAICDEALSLYEQSADSVDNSAGHLGAVKEKLQDLHFEVHRHVKSDPNELAAKLFARELGDSLELFYDAVLRYQPLLGQQGLKTYRALADAEWAKLRALGADERDPPGVDRIKITRIKQALAEISDDLDEVVGVMSHNLSSPYSYLRIATLYFEHGLQGKAIEWAEKGDQVPWKYGRDSRLAYALIQLYILAERFRDAVDIAWREHAVKPTFETYRQLAATANKADAWADLRQRAVDVMRKPPPKDAVSIRFGLNDRSELVRVFIAEGDADAAWQEAKEAGCSAPIWLELAKLREREHPEDAIPIYRNQVTWHIEQMTNSGYEQAVELLRHVKGLLSQTDGNKEFRQLVTSIRIRYGQRRNLMKLLDESGLV